MKIKPEDAWKTGKIIEDPSSHRNQKLKRAKLEKDQRRVDRAERRAEREPMINRRLSNALRKFHKLLSRLDFPERSRHDFHFLRKNLKLRNSGPDFEKAQHILNYLAPEDYIERNDQQ